MLTGHSIEARVYAEDPAAGFLPTGGHVAYVSHPDGEGVRVDTAIESGLDVSIDYDPMLAKIITWGEDREAARRLLVRALDETALLGFPTNIEFMRKLLAVSYTHLDVYKRQALYRAPRPDRGRRWRVERRRPSGLRGADPRAVRDLSLIHI